jgi:hypothetical protein
MASDVLELTGLRLTEALAGGAPLGGALGTAELDNNAVAASAEALGVPGGREVTEGAGGVALLEAIAEALERALPLPVAAPGVPDEDAPEHALNASTPSSATPRVLGKFIQTKMHVAPDPIDFAIKKARLSTTRGRQRRQTPAR